MEIYIIRHTSVNVPAGYAYGQTDVPLNISFKNEAENVKKQLEGLCFDKVWSSPLSRCLQLAEYCGCKNIILEHRIKEINFGEWEMKSWNEISSDPRSEAWFADWIHTPTPQGESFQSQYDRVCEFLDEIRKENANRIALFTHGGVQTCARVYNGEYPLEEAFKHVLPDGTIIKIEI